MAIAVAATVAVKRVVTISGRQSDTVKKHIDDIFEKAHIIPAFLKMLQLFLD